MTAVIPDFAGVHSKSDWWGIEVVNTGTLPGIMTLAPFCTALAVLLW